MVFVDSIIHTQTHTHDDNKTKGNTHERFTHIIIVILLLDTGAHYHAHYIVGRTTRTYTVCMV